MNIFRKLSLGGAVLALSLGTLALAGGVLPQSASAQSALTAQIIQPANNASYNVGQSVPFIASATGGTGPYSFVWTFGDGTQAFGGTQSKTYSAAGAKNVTLLVTDSNGAQATANVTVNVGAQQNNIVIVFTNPSNNATYNIGQTINFGVNVTGGNGTYTYLWNFGNGQTSTQQNPTFVFNTAGTYTVTLTVTDSNGMTQTATITIVVTTAGTNPTISSISPTSGPHGTTVTLTGANFGSNNTILFNNGAAGQVNNVASTNNGTVLTFVTSQNGVVGTTYTVSVLNTSNNTVSNSVNFTVTGSNTQQPVISNIQVINVTQTSATITWDTNIPASSRVIYDTTSHSNIAGLTGPNYGYALSTSETDTNPKVTAHSVTLTGLNQGTTYFFRVISQ